MRHHHCSSELPFASVTRVATGCASRAPFAGTGRHRHHGVSMNYDLEAARLTKDWAENPRWKGVARTYTAVDVLRLRGSLQVEHTLARRGAEKLWQLLHDEPFVNTLGALTGNQALQQVKAG